MKILAADFSSSQRTVAIAVDATLRSEVTRVGGIAAPAFEMITEGLRGANLEREQIDCLAVGLGPGSYTGIRAAIALAQGWQLARNIKLLGIPGIHALALEARRTGLVGPVNFVIDAQRDEFYLARYEIGASSSREISPLRLVARAEVSAASGIVAGPDIAAQFPGSHALFPTASAIAELAAQRNDFIDGAKLEPVYLRETNFVKAPPPRFPPAT